jgi:hypothetical protein
MAFFDSAFYDSGARFDEVAGPQSKPKTMKVKLELRERDDLNFQAFVHGHQDAMNGNANFPTPDPTDAVFDAQVQEFDDAMDDVREKEEALKTAVRIKNEKRAAVEASLNVRADYVGKTAKGVESIITSANFSARAAATPTNSLPRVENLKATMGDDAGAVDLGWDGNIKGKRGFLVEWREHTDAAEWGGGKFVTASKCTIDGLTPGKVYAFRVRALGPKELVGPWSDEAVKMSP